MRSRTVAVATALAFLAACGTSSVVRVDTFGPVTDPRVIEVESRIESAPTTALPTTATTTPLQASAIRVGDSTLIAKQWVGSIQVVNPDAAQVLEQILGPVPEVATDERYLVLGLGLRYVGPDAIGETSGLDFSLIDANGADVGRACSLPANGLFRNRFVVPTATAEFYVCAVVPADQAETVLLHVVDTDQKAVNLATTSGVGVPSRGALPEPTPIKGAAGSSGLPAQAGTSVSLGSWYAITLESVTREDVGQQIADDQVVVRVKWSLQTISTEADAARTQFVYGAYPSDGLQRMFQRCDDRTTPRPRPGGVVTVELCILLPKDEAATFFVHERRDKTVSYFTVPKV